MVNSFGTTRPAGIGIDVGTSGLKAVAVGRGGEVLAAAERSYPLLTPRPGWTEQDPRTWVDAAHAALRELGERLPAGVEPVALGLSGQMHGMVALDEAGKPVANAILWNDQRTAAAVAAIERVVPREEMIASTGNPAITGFQLSKVVWLRENRPQAFARTRHVLFPKDYVGYRLSGELFAEPCDASGSNAYNLHARAWDGDILEALDLDPLLWPQVVPSRSAGGTLLPELARDLGLPEGLPVVAGAGDNAAAAYGMGIVSDRPELGSLSLGTSGVIFAPTREARPDPRGRVHLFCHVDGGWYLLGVTLAAAGSLRWFRDAFAPGRSFEELTDLAAEVPPGSAGVVFKPYLAGERTPHLDPGLRGSFHGLSLATGLPELTRAVLEGVAFSLRDALEVMAPLGGPGSLLLTGGGSRSELWTRILADVLQVPLGKPTRVSGPAYGAARMALEQVGEPAPPEAPEAEWLEPGDFGPYRTAWELYRALGPRA